jgi:Cu/Zn superoxide dismutase
VRRITKAALGGLAGCALALGGTQFASGALLDFLKIHKQAEDLAITAVGPLDSAKAKITIDKGTDSTTFKIRVTGIDPTIVGPLVGAHLHTGRCVENTGGAAGPHYNHQVEVDGKVLPTLAIPSGPNVAEVSPNTEVWFDLEADDEGMAYDTTTVPFVPVDYNPDWVPGVMSVVVHALPTEPSGTPTTLVGSAGARQACFPLSVSGIFPTTPPSPTE